MSTQVSVLAAHAHRMRQAPTDSEAALWRALRSSQLGLRFRRQVPVLRFIVDFLAPSVRLIVEVDGGYHALRRGADARRDEKLRRAGYRVLRVDAELVIRDLPRALARIRAGLAEAG
jgi:very-short-patch-repair endonuclease